MVTPKTIIISGGFSDSQSRYRQSPATSLVTKLLQLYHVSTRPVISSRLARLFRMLPCYQLRAHNERTAANVHRASPLYSCMVRVRDIRYVERTNDCQSPPPPLGPAFRKSNTRPRLHEWLRSLWALLYYGERTELSYLSF